MQYAVSFANLDQVKHALNAAPTIAAKHFDRAIKASIFEVQAEAVPLTPVAKPMSWKRPNPKYKPGRLKGSYTVSFMPLKGILEPKTNYAIYVHEGTQHMPARPFLTGGVEKAENKVEKHFADAYANVMDEIAANAN